MKKFTNKNRNINIPKEEYSNMNGDGIIYRLRLQNDSKKEMCKAIQKFINEYIETENVINNFDRGIHVGNNNSYFKVTGDKEEYETYSINTNDMTDMINLLDDNNKKRCDFILEFYKKGVELGIILDVLDQEDYNLIEKGVM